MSRKEKKAREQKLSTSGSDPSAQQSQQQGQGHCEQKGEDHPLHRDGAEAVDL